MSGSDNFFARAEQAEFIQRVYREVPPVIQRYFEQENRLLTAALYGCRHILEIGCGTGRAVEAVPNRTSYTGVDIGFSYVAQARSQHPIHHWLCADACRLPFSASTFDAVFCIQNTLGNMPGIGEQVVSESLRVLRKPGRMILSVYAEDSFETRKQWYDRLIAAGIFERVWIDPVSPKIARSNTGWSSRCFDRSEIECLFEPHRVQSQVTKIGSLLYFCTIDL